MEIGPVLREGTYVPLRRSLFAPSKARTLAEPFYKVPALATKVTRGLITKRGLIKLFKELTTTRGRGYGHPVLPVTFR